MADILARLLPAVRDVRNPLAVGFTWMVVIGAIAYDYDFDLTIIGRSFTRALDGVPGAVLVPALAFAATLVGSGIVRLMQRVMETVAHRSSREYSPLDEPEPFVRSEKPFRRLAELPKRFWRDGVSLFGEPRQLAQASQQPAQADRDRYRETLQAYLTMVYRDERARLTGWTISSSGEDEPDPEKVQVHVNVHDQDLVLFRRHLREEANFAALASEQLLRFSLIPPVVVAAGAVVLRLSLEWSDVSVLLAAIGLSLIVFVLVQDYARTGSLMRRRWHQLAEEYPDWLPDAARAARQEFFRSKEATPWLEVMNQPGEGTRLVVSNRGTATAEDVEVKVVKIDGQAEWNGYHFNFGEIAPLESASRRPSDGTAVSPAPTLPNAFESIQFDLSWRDERFVQLPWQLTKLTANKQDTPEQRPPYP